ncbi:MAG: type VI secretion system contractile sheath large subunit [Phycisphaeraceae bacterium]|nr:type VI secretion system contractile sheath large subunit [Phycisphaeraceae bacterium]MCW5762076.1 type VI secretion system contractile sheath large subunit [Phycisphaeraceae bacterium]
MSMNFSFDHLRSTLRGERPGRPEPEQPFRVLVIGDLSGRASRGQVEPLSGRKVHALDIDTMDTVMSSLNVRLAIGASTPRALGMGFREIDDFHPDTLLVRVEVFGALRSLRARLLNPASSAAAAAEIRAWASPASSIIEPKPAEAPATPQSEFEALLGTGSRSGATNPQRSQLDALIRDLVGPSIVPGAEPDFAHLAATIDGAISDLMRGILHDPAFQSLEAAWRSVHELITRLELSEDLTLSVLDASRAELADDLVAHRGAGLMDLLVERPRRTAGANPWSVICLLESFDATVEDAHLAGGLALAAHAAGAPLLAGASAGMIGSASIAEQPRPENWTQQTSADAGRAWDLVQSMPEAAALGLALPRVLLRQPYSPRTNPIDAFEFDECPPSSPHESYLWGNAAMCPTLILARGFAERGWMLDVESGGDIESLPVVVRGSGSDAIALPCAEAWLTDTASQRLLERGVIPILSVQHRDAVRVPRLCSIVGDRLAARWA